MNGFSSRRGRGAFRKNHFPYRRIRSKKLDHEVYRQNKALILLINIYHEAKDLVIESAVEALKEW